VQSQHHTTTTANTTYTTRPPHHHLPSVTVAVRNLYPFEKKKVTSLPRFILYIKSSPSPCPELFLFFPFDETLLLLVDLS